MNTSVLSGWGGSASDPSVFWTSTLWAEGEFAGLKLVKFVFYYNGTDKLNLRLYCINGGWQVPRYSDFIYNGVRYTSTEDFVIEGKDAWQEVYFVVDGKDFNNGGIAAGGYVAIEFNAGVGTDSKGYLEMWFGNVRDCSDVSIESLLTIVE